MYSTEYNEENNALDASEKRKERKPIIQLVILQTQGQFCATALAGANAFTVFWLP
jgi:hypothetical protein